MLPTHHAEHETLELTQAINDWAEVGFYLFSSIQPDGGWQWVGDHIRPRVHAPEKWHWPLGVSLSTEFGYPRRLFAGHLHLGDSPDRRPKNRSVVSGI
jgi:hypothetical protein